MSVDGLSSPDEEPILGAHFLSTILRRVSVVDDRSDSYPSYTPTLPNVSLTTTPRVTPRRNEALPDYTLNSSESLSDLFDAVRQMSAVMEQLNHLRSLQRLHRGSRARMLFLSNLSTLNETHFDRSDSILNAQSENSSLDDLILQYAVQLSLQSEQPTVPPATKQAMKKLMRVTLQHSDSEILDCNRCPICLGGYESGARVIRMPCEHIFDEECVLKWLEQNRSCPICRKHVCEEHADTPPRQNESQEGDASELTNAFQFLNNGVAEFPTDSEQGENIALAELTVSTSSRGDSISNGTIEDYNVETTSVASSDITPPRIRNIRVISTSSPGRESSPGDSLLSFDSTGELSENSNLDSFISTSHSTHVTRTRWFPPRPSVIQDVELSSMRVRTEHVSSRVPPPSSSFIRRRLSSILRDSTAVSVLTDVNRSPLVIPEPQHLSSNTYFSGVHLLRSNSRVSLLDWRRQRNAA